MVMIATAIATAAAQNLQQGVSGATVVKDMQTEVATTTQITEMIGAGARHPTVR